MAVCFIKSYGPSVSWLLIQAGVLVFLSGCCEDVEHRPDQIYDALTKYELTTFVDSSGNYEQVFFVEEGMERFEDVWNECGYAQVGYAQYPYAEFELLHSGGTLRYEQYDGRKLYFPAHSIWYMVTGGWNGSYMIQDFEYAECNTYNYSDSVQQIYSVIIDKNYGLVMFSYKDEYRWERILDP